MTLLSVQVQVGTRSLTPALCYSRTTSTGQGQGKTTFSFRFGSISSPGPKPNQSLSQSKTERVSQSLTSKAQSLSQSSMIDD